MLNAVASSKLLKRAIKASNAFLNEARVKLTEEGIAIRAVDAGNVCLTDVFLPREDFEAFKAEKGVIGLDVDRLNGILKAVKDDFVEIDCSKKLHLKAGKTLYTLSLIDPSSLRQEPKLPVLDLKADAVVNANDFKNAVLMASKVTDTIVFEENDGFHLVAEGDLEGIKVELGSYGGEEARVMLSLEYLREIAKVLEKNDVVRIAMGNDLPVRIGIESDFSISLQYFIAPRIKVER